MREAAANGSKLVHESGREVAGEIQVELHGRAAGIKVCETQGWTKLADELSAGADDEIWLVVVGVPWRWPTNPANKPKEGK